MQLVAEIERLERELDTARAHVAEFAARAEIDPLTDVLNRRGFERELRRVVAHLRRYGIRAALLYLDLDAFKSVNDSHGHAAGDAVLKAAAAALSANVRASDIVARLGGDEFAVLLWHVSEADAERKAPALERAVENAIAHILAEGSSLTASAGVAHLATDDESASVLERADRAMYARKAARRALA